METFEVEFISPDRKLEFSGISWLGGRTAGGAFVIMANHEAAVMDLLSGEVTMSDKQGSVTSFMVSRALLSVKDNRCVITGDSVFLRDDFDSEKLNKLKEEIMRSSSMRGELGEAIREDLGFISMVLKG